MGVDEPTATRFGRRFKAGAGDPAYLWSFDFGGEGDVDGWDNSQFKVRFDQDRPDNWDDKLEAKETFFADRSGLSSNEPFTRSRGTGTILKRRLTTGGQRGRGRRRLAVRGTNSRPGPGCRGRNSGWRA